LSWKIYPPPKILSFSACKEQFVHICHLVVPTNNGYRSSGDVKGHNPWIQ
jgi:hypothetical protein